MTMGTWYNALGSARLGSARLGSARLGSARSFLFLYVKSYFVDSAKNHYPKTGGICTLPSVFCAFI